MNINFTAKAFSILNNDYNISHRCDSCREYTKNVFIYKSKYFENYIANEFCNHCKNLIIKDRLYLKFDYDNFNKIDIINKLNKLILLE
jgi:hypothetical protein